ncbi:MAG: 16S rRNA (uracil(1498)-N(3))-methyltransferase [Winogradskyella sp.]|nr:16S rRNA (uracil(1498)-N(3))-methyltransferase [Winogradskyella sp.]
MQVFYNPHINHESVDVDFDKEESRHITKVLRKNTGDLIEITNGKGYLFTAELTFTSPSKCQATIKSHTYYDKRSYHLHMVVAPTKMNDRFEWFLEKATEIGVDEITPILCENSERRVIKHNRFERIIQSAMKQSLNFHKPILNPLTTFSEFIESPIKRSKFIAHCEDLEKTSLKDCISANGDYTILIGPEGDFSVKEIEMALQRDYKPVTLGESRLRTETAAIVACHSISFINQ